VLGLFRKNLFVNVIFLFLFVVALRAYFFVAPSVGDAAWQFSGITNFESFNDSRFLKVLLSIVLIAVQAYLVSRIVIQNRMSRAGSLIPGAVFALFVCTAMEPKTMTVLLWANLFFVISLRFLFQIYKKHRPVGTIFNAGFFLGLAVLIYFPYAFYFFAALIGLSSLRKYDLKEFLQLITGFFAVMFIAGILFYYNDKLGDFYSIIGYHFKLPVFKFDNPVFYVKPVIAFAILSLMVFFQSHLTKKKKFEAIKKIELMYWVLFIGFLILFFLKKTGEDYFILISTPIAILSGLILESKISTVVKEFVFILFVVFYVILLLNVF